MNMDKKEAADIIEAFITGTGGDWDWDDFTSIKLKDPELEEIRIACALLRIKYPPKEKGHYCGPEGIEVLRNMVRQLRM